MIVRLVCADCGKEIRPFNTSSIIPDEVKIKISTCTCQIVTCEACEDIEILTKDKDALEEKLGVATKVIESLETQLKSTQESLKGLQTQLEAERPMA